MTMKRYMRRKLKAEALGIKLEHQPEHELDAMLEADPAAAKRFERLSKKTRESEIPTAVTAVMETVGTSVSV